MKRFWDKVDQSGGADVCWPWLASRMGSGYGQFYLGRIMGAHRAAYEIAKGPVPAELYVLHSCDNKLCCNPAHLSLGTHQDNMDDMTSRQRRAVGERHPLAKLTAENVIEIRRLRAAGVRSPTISRKFGVTPRLIRKVLDGQGWRHV